VRDARSWLSQGAVEDSARPKESMPRYYFHIREGKHLVKDEEGLDLPSLLAAEREAEMSGRELLADMLRDRTPLDGQALEITNDTGSVLKVVPLKSLFWISA
jgi:hypothetical protein